jgi:hypothetical protein
MRAARRILLTTLLMTISAACSRHQCTNQAFYGLPSPDGKFIAFIFHRTCAAPAVMTTEVSLMPFHQSLRNEPGNVLAAPGEQPVKVSWHGAMTLLVTGFTDPIYRRTEPLDAVAIEFR